MKRTNAAAAAVLACALGADKRLGEDFSQGDSSSTQLTFPEEAAPAYPVTLPDKVVLGENSAAMRFSLSADSHEAVPMGKRMQGTVGRAARTAPRGWVRPASSRKAMIPRSSCSMTATRRRPDCDPERGTRGHSDEKGEGRRLRRGQAAARVSLPSASGWPATAWNNPAPPARPEEGGSLPPRRTPSTRRTPPGPAFGRKPGGSARL